ncbi:LysM and putative peptidoglycan-binding domain-containing protein 4 [Halotydeus destructor]|nr:LysM and putative peptidoglycan-binding domain-containing protein 4 [Halotydeus destructor]
MKSGWQKGDRDELLGAIGGVGEDRTSSSLPSFSLNSLMSRGSRILNTGYTRLALNGDEDANPVSSSDEELQTVGFELRERNHSPEKSKTKKVNAYYDDERKSKVFPEHTIIREIEPGDSLQNLSLKCGVSVAEIKRVNKLMTDQEFHGLKFIKIPVNRYGLLTGVLVHQINTSNSYTDLLTGDASQQSTTQTTNSEKPLVIGVGLKRTFNADNSSTDVKKFIENLDKDLEDIRSVTTNYKSSLNETDGISLDSPTPGQRSRSPLLDGADCGLSLFHLLCFAAVILILIPVIYVFVVEEKQMSANHTHLLHGSERHSFNVPLASHNKIS